MNDIIVTFKFNVILLLPLSHKGYDESQSESYDSWAERMTHEHRRKHESGPLPSGKHKKTKDDAKSRHKHKKDTKEEQFAWDRAHKKHEKERRRNAERSQQRLLDLKSDYLQRCAKVFDKDAADSPLRYDDIPWPKNSRKVDSMVEVLVCDVNTADEQELKKFMRTQRLVWHPDKFVQKLGQRLVPDDRDRILERVTQLSQALNRVGEVKEAS